MSLAIVLQGMTIMTYVVILAGGKQMRETGWRVLTLFLVLIGLVQCSGMALVVSSTIAYAYAASGKCWGLITGGIVVSLR